MIDGGAKFARTLGVPANEGGTHGPMGACVVTDGAVYVPLRTQDLAETLQRLIAEDLSRHRRDRYMKRTETFLPVRVLNTHIQGLLPSAISFLRCR